MTAENGLETYEYTGESFKVLLRYEGWRVAMLNHGAPFEEANFFRVEKHHLTDEVFVLLTGNATLVIGETLQKIPMEQNKVYNVKKDVWHHIFTTEGTQVLIVENIETGAENSEYLEVK